MAQLLQPPFEELEALVKDRLRLCALEIHGVVGAWTNQPASRIDVTDMPCAYSYSGPTFTPSQNSRTQGDHLYGRRFIQRFLIVPWGKGLDDPETGGELQSRADAFLGRIKLYYAGHPRLHLQETPPLKYVQYLEFVEDSGLEVGPSPGGGGQCASIDVTIGVVMRQLVPKALTIYREP